MHPSSESATFFQHQGRHRDASGGSTASVRLQHVRKTNRKPPASSFHTRLLAVTVFQVTNSVLLLDGTCFIHPHPLQVQTQSENVPDKKKKEKKRRKGFSQSGRKALYKPGSR